MRPGTIRAEAPLGALAADASTVPPLEEEAEAEAEAEAPAAETGETDAEIEAEAEAETDVEEALLAGGD